MLWLIKWTIILLLVGGAWFSYDFITQLNSHERQALKLEILDIIDGEPETSLSRPMVQKAKDDFFVGLRLKIKNLVHKVLD